MQSTQLWTVQEVVLRVFNGCSTDTLWAQTFKIVPKSMRFKGAKLDSKSCLHFNTLYITNVVDRVFYRSDDLQQVSRSKNPVSP